MVIIITISSLRSIGHETSLLFIFAPMLSIYNFFEISKVVYKGDIDTKVR